MNDSVRGMEDGNREFSATGAHSYSVNLKVDLDY